MNRKSLITFFGITFGLAWILFTLPVVVKNDSDPTRYLVVMQICFALAMWAPGIGAIVATRFIEGKPILKSLRLNTLGPKRYYLVAWLLPALLTVATLGVSLLLGTATYDGTFAFVRESLANVPAGTPVPDPQTLVLIQILAAFTIGPVINTFFALGEELGWRGFLLGRLEPLGTWPAILLSGAIWGIWHAPTTLLHGYNFPQHPYLGVLVMTVGCMWLGVVFAWLYLKTRSPWVVALAHGALNAVAGLGFYFLKPGFDTALAGSPLGLAGWLPIAAVIVLLIALRQFTARSPEPQQATP